MKVEMSKELWNAVIVAIDCDLDDYHSKPSGMGTGECPSLDVRYGKMLQARGIIREPQFNVRGDEDLKTVLDFMLDYGGMGSLPNMDEGESGDLAYEAALRLAGENNNE